ncbi:MAG: FKBP-type peptidyl-prolyl cis-trans isomerase [Coriobacteriales bacterium]|jgi:FKBP-type peptidyl-prolyl cis-trans isomerase 2|nr:FKBP-type peptidyl-prolyl cis-trans isomerase [Coriobacteriales bacterium]
MIEIGQKALVHYVGTLDDGSEFDNSYRREQPLELIVGAQQVLPGFDKAVSEMEQVGDRCEVHIPAAEAYGFYDESLIEKAPFKAIPNAGQLPVGSYIMVSTPSGPARVKVDRVTNDLVFFDHNHELADKDLTFTIELVSLPGASGSNIENEQYHGDHCGCGCSKLRKQLSPEHDEITHSH